MSYRNSLPDLLGFQFYTLPRLRGMQVLAVCIVAVFSYTMFGAVRQTNGSIAVKTITFLVLVVLLVVAVGAATLIVTGLLSIPRLRKQLGIDHTLELSESGVVATTGTRRQEVPWVAVHRVRQTRTSVLIYVSERAAHVVPKRVFRSLDEARAFYDFAAAKQDAKEAA